MSDHEFNMKLLNDNSPYIFSNANAILFSFIHKVNAFVSYETNVSHKLNISLNFSSICGCEMCVVYASHCETFGNTDSDKLVASDESTISQNDNSLSLSHLHNLHPYVALIVLLPLLLLIF